jgi:putative membrane protein
MPTEGSLNHSMDNAKKHYSSLFTVPSVKKSYLFLFIVCAVGVTLTAYTLTPSIYSAALGIGLFTVTILTDLLVSKILLRNDPIFILRRTAATSLTGWLIWLVFLVLGSILNFFFSSILWIKLALIGYGAILTLRFIVISATSNSAEWRQITSALLQPILCIMLFLGFWAVTSTSITQQILPYAILAPIISYVAVYLFLLSLDRLGKSTFGLPAMSFFRAFILNWVTDDNGPLEKHLADTGQDADISVSFIKFDAEKPKTAIIVPLVHPGPFKNIGSSLLPSMLKHEFDQTYGCDCCTPLGILGHELDLASQEQNHKIVNEVLKQAKTPVTATLASPFTRATSGCATASCQIFGDTAFIAVTMAPLTTEDMPQELGRLVTEEAQRLGFKHAVIVNDHNALDDENADMNAHLTELKEAAFACLKQAVTLPTKPFKIGSATLYPAEFTQKMGMGTGGITAIVVEVEAQKTAYVVIDGNNMIPHLREKILSALTAAGFDECEVFTTDTHAVSAIVTGERGYHPIGEAMNPDVLIGYLVDVAKKAAQTLETAKSGFVEFTVPKVRVIGEERINSISTLVDKGITMAKKTAPAIFGAEGLLLILLLLLF